MAYPVLCSKVCPRCCSSRATFTAVASPGQAHIVTMDRSFGQAAAVWRELPGGGLALRYDPRLRAAMTGASALFNVDIGASA